MSLEEDIELRDLVIQKALEPNGCMAKIRAQLRASIFLAFSEDERLQKKRPMLNTKVKSQLETSDGKLTFCLIREFLEFFDLYFTISVFEPETYMGSAYKYEGRKKTLQDLNIQEIDEKSDVPVLLQLIRKARGICFLKEDTSEISRENNDCNSFSSKSKTESQIQRSENEATTSKINLMSATSTPKCILDVKALAKHKVLNETFDKTGNKSKHLQEDHESLKPSDLNVQDILLKSIENSEQESTNSIEENLESNKSSRMKIQSDNLKSSKETTGDCVSIVSSSSKSKSSNSCQKDLHNSTYLLPLKSKSSVKNTKTSFNSSHDLDDDTFSLEIDFHSDNTSISAESKIIEMNNDSVDEERNTLNLENGTNKTENNSVILGSTNSSSVTEISSLISENSSNKQEQTDINSEYGSINTINNISVENNLNTESNSSNAERNTVNTQSNNFNHFNTEKSNVNTESDHLNTENNVLNTNSIVNTKSNESNTESNRNIKNSIITKDILSQNYEKSSVLIDDLNSESDTVNNTVNTDSVDGERNTLNIENDTNKSENNSLFLGSTNSSSIKEISSLISEKSSIKQEQTDINLEDGNINTINNISVENNLNTESDHLNTENNILNTNSIINTKSIESNTESNRNIKNSIITTKDILSQNYDKSSVLINDLNSESVTVNNTSNNMVNTDLDINTKSVANTKNKEKFSNNSSSVNTEEILSQTSRSNKADLSVNIPERFNQTYIVSPSEKIKSDSLENSHVSENISNLVLNKLSSNISKENTEVKSCKSSTISTKSISLRSKANGVAKSNTISEKSKSTSSINMSLKSKSMPSIAKSSFINTSKVGKLSKVELPRNEINKIKDTSNLNKNLQNISRSNQSVSQCTLSSSYNLPNFGILKDSSSSSQKLATNGSVISDISLSNKLPSKSFSVKDKGISSVISKKDLTSLENIESGKAQRKSDVNTSVEQKVDTYENDDTYEGTSSIPEDSLDRKTSSSSKNSSEKSISNSDIKTDEIDENISSKNSNRITSKIDSKSISSNPLKLNTLNSSNSKDNTEQSFSVENVKSSIIEDGIKEVYITNDIKEETYESNNTEENAKLIKVPKEYTEKLKLVLKNSECSSTGQNLVTSSDNLSKDSISTTEKELTNLQKSTSDFEERIKSISERAKYLSARAMSITEEVKSITRSNYRKYDKEKSRTSPLLRLNSDESLPTSVFSSKADTLSLIDSDKFSNASAASRSGTLKNSIQGLDTSSFNSSEKLKTLSSLKNFNLPKETKQKEEIKNADLIKGSNRFLKKVESNKSKRNLASDLPALPLNKPYVSENALLPSLFKNDRAKSKGMEVKNNSEESYKEDFMSGSEIDEGLNNTSFLKGNKLNINLLLLESSENEKSSGSNKSSFNTTDLSLSSNLTDSSEKCISSDQKISVGSSKESVNKSLSKNYL